MTSLGANAPERPRDVLRPTVVGMLWLAVLVVLFRYGAHLIPDAVGRQLSVEAYSALVQLVTMALGIGACFRLLDKPKRVLGLVDIGQGRGLLYTALLAPAIHVAICYVAIGLALPTLREELARGGAALVRSQGGAIVSAMTQPSLLGPMLWAVVVSPLGEELLFRGSLWGGLQGLLERLGPAVRAEAEVEGLPLERSVMLDSLGWTVRNGTLSTLLTTGIFASLHADLQGSQGIVRLASATGLGLACGMARQLTGTLAAPLLLHVLLNTLTLASARRWVVSELFPKYYTVPTLVSLVGGIGLIVAVGVALATASRRRR